MDPLSTQSNVSINHPSIFVNQDGSSIQVFTEACSIKGRPKLMRTLRNFGASLCCDPKGAQIILVDQETTDGKKFIRNWGQDKVVLHYAWAKKSIQEGKALLGDCNWGGYLTIDDGFPIETEDADQLEPDNPLPTPRVTPVESKAIPASRLSHPAQDAPLKRDLSMAPSQASMGTNDLTATVAMPNLSQAMPSMSSIPMNGTDVFPQTPYTMQMPSMGSQMTPMMMMTQYMMMMMNSSNYQYNGQSQPTDFNSALVDALRNHNVPWPSSQPPQESLGHFSMHNHQTVTRLSPDQNYPYPNFTSNLLAESNSQPTLTEAPVRKKRRASNASSDSFPIQDLVKTKIKSKSMSPTPKRHKASLSATQPSSERKLFHSESGKELSFFVQVEMHNRSGVVTAIKKNGGKIEGNNEIADYAILASGATKTKTFKDLLLSTVSAGRPALSARFVHDSVAQNVLLDTRDYAFESPATKTRKRTAQDDDSSNEKFDEMERRRLNKNAKEAARRQRAREEAAQISTPPKKKKKSTSKGMSVPAPAQSGPPSPTPPLTRETASSGFKFTESERAYAMKYVQLLLTRDHEISTYAIGAALHNKMPHHSLGSWRSYISSPSVRDDIDHLRKRAGIVFRKSQEQLQASQSVPEPQQQTQFTYEPEDSVITPITPPPTSVDEFDTDRKMAEEDDLNAAANFFAANEDDNESESVIWARLTSQVTCKTAGSWEEFYNLHHEEVVRRYEKLCASQ